jgi:hypothetical protein
MQPSRFMEMLAKGKMWFPSVALLRERDPFEGVYPLSNKREQSQIDNDLQYARKIIPGMSEENGFSNVRAMAGSRGAADDENVYAKIFYVSCWHASPWESALLWSAYASEQQGIVIKSSVGRLMAGIPDQIKNLGSGISDVVVAPVRYVNRREATLPGGLAKNLWNLMYQKQRCFSLEQEVRAGFLMYTDKGASDLQDGAVGADRGKLVDCDFSKIIEEVRVAPFAPPALFAEIETFKHQHGFQWPLRKSAIVDDS